MFDSFLLAKLGQTSQKLNSHIQQKYFFSSILSFSGTNTLESACASPGKCQFTIVLTRLSLFSLLSNKTRRSVRAARLTRLTVSSSSQFYRGSLEIDWLFLSSECMCVHIGICECMWKFLRSRQLSIAYHTSVSISPPLLWRTLLLFTHYSSLSIYISPAALLSSTSEHQSHFQGQHY